MIEKAENTTIIFSYCKGGSHEEYTCIQLSRKCLRIDSEDSDSDASLRSISDEDMYEYIEVGDPTEYVMTKPLQPLELVVDSLKPAVYYDFIIASKNKVGWTVKPDQSMLRIRTSSAPPQSMEAPSPVRTTCHSIQMSWKMPKNDNGERVLSFELQHRRARGGVWKTTCTVASVVFEFNLVQLGPDEGYKFRIRSKNVCGWSAFSPETSKIRSNAAASVKEHGRATYI